MSSASELAVSWSLQQVELEKFSIPVSACLALEVYSSTQHGLPIRQVSGGFWLLWEGF